MLGIVPNYLNFLHMKLKRGKNVQIKNKPEEFENGKMEESFYRKHEIRKITPTAATLNTFSKKECVFCSNGDQESSVS